MKKLLVIALVLLVNISNAQNFTLGPSVPEVDFRGDVFFNTTLNKGYLIDGTNVAPLEDYIKPLPSLKLKSESFSGKVYVLGYIPSNNKNFIVYGMPDKQLDIATVYFQEMSDDMTLLGSAIKITSFKGAFSTEGPRVIVIGSGMIKDIDITMVKSENQNEIILVRDRETSIEVKAFSLDKGEMWSKEFVMHDKKGGHSIDDIKVTENGNVYIQGYSTGKHFLLCYAPGTKKEKIHYFEDDEKAKIELMGFAITLLNDGTPFLAHLSYDGKKFDGSYASYKINPSTFELIKFGSGLLPDQYNKKSIKTRFASVFFGVRGIVELDNGNIAFAVGAVTTSGKGDWASNVLVAAMDKDGNALWNSIINKTQIYGGRHIGHRLFSSGNNVYLMYNDHPDNFDLLPGSKQKEDIFKSKMYVCSIKFDESGKAEKTKPFSKDRKQYSSFDVSQVVKIKKDLYHIRLKIGEEYKFARLLLE